MSASSKPAGLHVAQFIDSMDPGGAEEVVLNLAAGLPNHGIRTTVMHFGNPWIAEQIEARGLAGCVLDPKRYKSVLTLPLFVRTFADVLRDRQVDVLHSHLLGAIFAGALAARRAGIPSVGTIHDVYSLHESRMNPRYLRWAQRAGCRLVAVCDAMRNEVQSVCGLRDVERIYNGVDFDRFPEPEPRQSGAPVRIVTVARAVPVKRLDLLLQAFAALDADNPAELLVVGDGPLLPELQTRAASIGVAGAVRFLGHRDDVPDLLAGSDIYALVSDSEGMSVSILESMAAGLPAVVTDVGGNRELVADGESGFVVPPGDAGALARALSTLVNEAGRRSHFGGHAKQRAGEMFTVGRMRDRYANLIRGLVSHG